MKSTKQRIIEYILEFVIAGTLGLAVMVSGEYVYYRLLPVEAFVKYEYVRAAHETFALGEELHFESRSAYYRKADYTWNDVLYCKKGDNAEYTYFSDQTSNASDFTPKKGLGVMKSQEWNYTADSPSTVPQECFIQSTVTVKTRFDITKTTMVQSEPFYIK